MKIYPTINDLLKEGGIDDYKALTLSLAHTVIKYFALKTENGNIDGYKGKKKVDNGINILLYHLGQKNNSLVDWDDFSQEIALAILENCEGIEIPLLYSNDRYYINYAIISDDNRRLVNKIYLYVVQLLRRFNSPIDRKTDSIEFYVEDEEQTKSIPKYYPVFDENFKIVDSKLMVDKQIVYKSIIANKYNINKVLRNSKLTDDIECAELYMEFMQYLKNADKKHFNIDSNIINLRLQGLKYDEIGIILGCQKSCISKHFSRLKKHYADFETAKYNHTPKRPSIYHPTTPKKVIHNTFKIDTNFIRHTKFKNLSNYYIDTFKNYKENQLDRIYF